jgi:protein-export membrane protein SecD
MLYFTRWKALAIILTALVVCLCAVPPASAQSASDDKQGGLYLVLEVDSKYVKKAELEQVRDDVRRVLRDARIGYQGLAVGPDSVGLRIPKEADLPTALIKLRELSQPSGSKGSSSWDIADAGGGNIVISVPQRAMTERIDQTIRQSMEVFEHRINELGIGAPVIQRQGPDRIVVEVPGAQDLGHLKALLGKIAKLEIRLVDISLSPDQVKQGMVPADSEMLLTATSPKVPYLIKKQVLVSGVDVIDAQAGFDRGAGQPIVSFRFNTPGARKFAQATAENVGQPFAIVLDNEVISAPVVREPITGGAGQISGNFTRQQANDLAIMLRTGALPAPLTVIEDRSRI